MKASRTSILTAAALSVLTFVAIPAASADSLDRDIQRDKAQIARERAEIRQLDHKLSVEQRELAAARAREKRDIDSGHFFRAWRDAKEARREAGEVNAVKSRIANERAELARERADVARDIARRNRRDYD